MNVIFMGTPDFAKESLKAIYNAGYNVLAVVTNPDTKKGRGMKLGVSPVKEFAKQKNLLILQPEKIKKNIDFIQNLKELKPDVICVVAYGKILPKEILEIPKLGCVNVHGSLLPKYRGAAPIQWAVLNGDKKTGITTMYMDSGMDTGDIILKKEVDILPDETTGELWSKMAMVGAELLVETLNQIKSGVAPRVPQPKEGSVAPMFDKSIAKINWNTNTSIQIKNLVRGLNPIMGAYTVLNNKKIKFWKTDIEIAENIKVDNIKDIFPGTIIKANEKEGLFIKTIDGIIKVIEIQGENAKKMDIKDFLRGNKLQEGDRFV